MRQKQHTFRAETAHEAIQLAKEALGPEALILEVRRASRDGLVEILAAPSETGDVPILDYSAALPRIDELARSKASPFEGRPDAANGRTTNGIDSEIEFVQSFGVSEPLAAQIASACTTGSAFRRHAAVARALQQTITTRDLGPLGEERIVAAMIGPTGVGKTTTIAKLAAVFSAGRRWRVALITTDTYRVGGIAQLKTFAELLQLPFFTAYTREDLEAALAATRDADVVFIDTPGCNPYDVAMLKELRNLLTLHTPINSYLTLAMTTDFQELLSAAQRFSLFAPVGLITTKLDETRRAASVIGLAEQVRLPLHYTCSGALVPEDIALATPALLADLMLGALEPYLQEAV